MRAPCLRSVDYSRLRSSGRPGGQTEDEAGVRCLSVADLTVQPIPAPLECERELVFIICALNIQS